MQEGAKTVLQFSWAVSVFTMQELVQLFSCRGTAAESLAAVSNSTDQIANQLKDPWQSLFRTGAEMQRMATDATFRTLSGGADVSSWMQMSSEMVQRGLDAMNLVRPGAVPWHGGETTGWGPVPKPEVG